MNYKHIVETTEEENDGESLFTRLFFAMGVESYKVSPEKASEVGHVYFSFNIHTHRHESDCDLIGFVNGVDADGVRCDGGIVNVALGHLFTREIPTKEKAYSVHWDKVQMIKNAYLED
jgi:hypothetical protein